MIWGAAFDGNPFLNSKVGSKSKRKKKQLLKALPATLFLQFI
jgi:hypothetical protein